MADKPHKDRDFTIARVRTLKRQGYSYAQIGRMLGFTAGGAHYYGKMAELANNVRLCAYCGSPLQEKTKKPKTPV